MLFFILGAIIGSFLNVVIVRTPKNESIITPRSHCPKCREMIPFYYNIPILSYIILNGKCISCKKNISIQYIFIEIFTGVLFYIVLGLFPLNEAILLLIVFCSLIVLSMIDISHLLIPTYSIVILYILIIPKIFIYDQNLIEIVFGSIVSILYLAIPSLLLAIIKKNKDVIGFGDILLSGFVGSWLGSISGILCLFLASIIGIVFFIYLKLIDEKIKLLRIPFGACISISFIIIVIIEEWYKFKLFFF